jgi:hypothetical protein
MPVFDKPFHPQRQLLYYIIYEHIYRELHIWLSLLEDR